MNLKDSFDNYVIFHGPPYVGKSSYFASELSGAFKRISPSEMFQSGLVTSLRQMINNHIIKPLLNGDKIAVDDSMQTTVLRRSYITTVLDKVPYLNCTCVSLRPEFGREQLMWKREFCLAEAVLNQEWHLVEKILSTDIDRWYRECEPVSDDEDVKKFEVVLPLQVTSQQKFAIPCLLVERRGLIDPKLLNVLNSWHHRNIHGRIIAVFESNQTTRIEDVKKSVLEFLKCIRIKTELVVYAHYVDSGSQSDLTSFMTSVLAFLMRLHCLDLFNSDSVYLYETMKHRKMVEWVGMRHIKLERAMANPDLLRHGTTRFPVPKMLQSLRFLPCCDVLEENALTPPSIPLLPDVLGSEEFVGRVSVGSQRTIYITAKNEEILNRYQEHSLKRQSDAAADAADAVASEQVNSRNDEEVTKKKKKKRGPTGDFVTLPSWMTSKKRKSNGESTKVAFQEGGKNGNTIDCGSHRSSVSSTKHVRTEKEILKAVSVALGKAEKTRGQNTIEFKTDTKQRSTLSEDEKIRNYKHIEKNRKLGEDGIFDEILSDFERGTRYPSASEVSRKREAETEFRHVEKEVVADASNLPVDESTETFLDMLMSTSFKCKNTPSKQDGLHNDRTAVASTNTTNNETLDSILNSAQEKILSNSRKSNVLPLCTLKRSIDEGDSGLKSSNVPRSTINKNDFILSEILDLVLPQCTGKRTTDESESGLKSSNMLGNTTNKNDFNLSEILDCNLSQCTDKRTTDESDSFTKSSHLSKKTANRNDFNVVKIFDSNLNKFSSTVDKESQKKPTISLEPKSFKNTKILKKDDSDISKFIDSLI